MKVIIDKQLVKLDEKQVLGAGGEAVVLRYGDQAVKLYHNPTPVRAQKLQDLWKLQPSLPQQVVWPVAPVYDQAGTKPLGFTMPALPDGLVALTSLGNKNFRATNGVTVQQVANLFLKIHDVLKAIHGAGLVVGDLNDLNLLFEGTNPAFIDVDSYQFGNYPCPVATELYLDPQLYGLDLTLRPSFAQENDWYSYAVLLFRSLLLAHPYGGTHPKIKLLTQRAQQRLTVFHPEVTYPKMALNLNYLNDELAGAFYEIFAGGERGIFSAKALVNYAGELVECPGCKALFPASRRICPACQGMLAFVLPPVKLEAGIAAEELVVAAGPVLALRVFGKRLYCLAREENLAVLYTKEPGQAAQRKPLFRWLPGASYRFMDGYLVVSPAGSPDLMVLDITQDEAKPLLKTTTGRFNGQAVFATTAEALYRMAGGMLLRGTFKYGQLVERPVTAVQEGQTWFEVSADAHDEDIITGFSRVFREWHWFRVAHNERRELAISQPDANEIVINWAVKPGLILRQTRQAGLDYLRLDGLDAKGTPLFSQRRKFADENMAGGLYSGGVALWPGADGLVKERVDQGQQVALPSTGPYINSATNLDYYNGGILAVTDNRVWSLKIV